jgi:2'-5' RNA ligase
MLALGTQELLQGGESLSVSVELYPDAAFSALVIRARSAAIGFSSIGQPQADWRPHLTLLIADEMDRQRGMDVVMGIAAEIAAIPMTFSRLATFGSVPDHVFLAPNPNPELDRAHRLVHDRLGPEVKGLWPNYVANRWIPHVTIVEHVPTSQLEAALAAVRESLPPLPLAATIEEIGLADYPPLERVAVFPLQG